MIVKRNNMKSFPEIILIIKRYVLYDGDEPKYENDTFLKKLVSYYDDPSYRFRIICDYNYYYDDVLCL